MIVKEVSFTVIGKPQPAGSKRGFPIKRSNGTIGVAISDSNPKAKEWKSIVIDACQEAYKGPLLRGHLAVYMTFYLPRPKGHFGSGRNAHLLRQASPQFPTVKPDVLKLARGTEDALTGVLWGDDAQTVDLLLQKRYGEPARAVIKVICHEEEPTCNQSNGSEQKTLGHANALTTKQPSE